MTRRQVSRPFWGPEKEEPENIRIAHFLPSCSPPPIRSSAVKVLLLLPILLSVTIFAQTAPYQVTTAKNREFQALKGHVPRWAKSEYDAGAVPSNYAMEHLTLVLSGSPEQEFAFEQLLRNQLNLNSADYHHWLTPEELAARFGPTERDVEDITRWLASEGLEVTWVAPSRRFIGFKGTAGSIGRAFQCEFHFFIANGDQRISVSSDPEVPPALAPRIRAIRGLSIVRERPENRMSSARMYSPLLTDGGSYYISPADFDTIYNVPTTLTGSGVTVGVVAESRTDFADFDNFRLLTGATFPDPTEVVPTAFGGVDPGPAATAPPGNELQTEATVDVTRVGSVAPAAAILLVVASEASGGIEADTEYLVNTSPVPVQVINISFAGCELQSSAAIVDYWDSLFEQASAEGISTFVASGDAGASGCDGYFDTPPLNPMPNNPNAICSSSYDTCVGGTEFNDSADPSSYWSPTNGPGLSSALSYIPEGAWNDSLSPGGAPSAAASGGGVSMFIQTPLWQTGTGVPSERSGRYTPDISFSSSAHDGYVFCIASDGGGCVASNGTYFVPGAGTSVTAPGMAGVTALLDQKMGGPQGNLTPELYSMALNTPTAFHDVTVDTSGVTNCDVNSPSMCNNSIPSSTGQAGTQAGYLVTTGYDEATGLGSLDVQTFLDNFGTLIQLSTVTVSPATIATGGSTTLTFQLSGAAPAGGALITLSSSNTSAFPVPATITIAAGQDTGSISVQAGTVASPTTVSVTATYGDTSSRSQITLTVPGFPTVSGLSFNPTTVANGSSTTLTVLLSAAAPAGGAVVNLISSNSSAFPSPSTVTVPAGQESASVVVQVTAATSPTTVTVTANYNGGSARALLMLTVPSLPIISALGFTPSTVAGGSFITLTVQLSGVAPVGDAIVALNSGNANIVLVPSALAVLAGQASATLVVQTNSVNSPTIVAITASYNGSSQQAQLTLDPVIAPTVSTGGASNVTNDSATIGGLVNPNGANTTAAFEYGTSSTLVGASQTAIQNLGLGSSSVALSATLTGLSSGTVYYYEAAASSRGGSTLGAINSFTTLAQPALSTPTVSVSPAFSSISNWEAVSVTISVTGASGGPTPTGIVTLAGGGFTSSTTALSGGIATIGIPAGSLTTGNDTMTANYTPDSSSASIYNSASGSAVIIVTNSNFSLTATAVTIAPGQSGTSTITVNSTTGYAGTVTLTCAVTSSPVNASDLPTCISSQNVTLTSSVTNGTASVSVNTTAPTNGAMALPELRTRKVWPIAGGEAIFALLVLAWVPQRRAKWKSTLRMVVVIVALGNLAACGGGSSGSTATGPANLGTTVGAYTITVTGTGSDPSKTTATTTLSVTVN